ncbi:DUF2637 domain-containing protein [Streptomyces iranensis]|uniref:DUF2637 domain-containing protein n=1 Tax=Streptomyces iranensis TaxID=576784 RepID=A0A060ZYH4_9ACTN|nr:DUF2637 domain-containing protein [Streptomyces iranensis]MBP2066718.1 hypothetical protein [Streptomyces iranensis]CDR08538.1 predicted protein [Streptomyces iranensis]
MTIAAETDQATAPQVPPLSRMERILLLVVGAAGIGVGGLGFAASFDAVSAAGARWGFRYPWMLPVGIDAAVPVFTVANLLLIRMNMPLAWVRFVPWALTLVTCWLNIASGHSLSAKVAHGTMPLLWVVLSEVAAHVYAVRIGAAIGSRMERIRRSRWLLAPLSTFALWRRMTLWEITSYADALARERERQLARAELREQHGWRWRSKTPRRERVLLKLGDQAPASAAEPDPVPAPPPPEEPKQKQHQAEEPKAEPKPRRRPGRAAKPSRKARGFDELLTEARKVTANWPEERLKAEPIRQELRCSAKHARSLRDALKAERASGGRPLHAVDEPEEGTGQTEGEAA